MKKERLVQMTDLLVFKEGKHSMIAMSIGDIRTVLRAVSQSLPEIEVSVHNGDVDEVVLEDLQEAYDLLESFLERSGIDS